MPADWISNGPISTPIPHPRHGAGHRPQRMKFNYDIGVFFTPSDEMPITLCCRLCSGSLHELPASGNGNTRLPASRHLFSSPIFGTMSSAQTREMEVHFPIKAVQPELELEVQFRSEEDYEDFSASSVGITSAPPVQPPARPTWSGWNWPERNIDNWTGVIKAFKAGGERRVFAPRQLLSWELIDSMVSSRTDIASMATAGAPSSGMGMGPGSGAGSPTQAEQTTPEQQLGLPTDPGQRLGCPQRGRDGGSR